MHRLIRNLTIALAASVLLTGALLSPVLVEAQQRQRRGAQAEDQSGPRPTVADVDTLAAQLDSRNADEVRDAITKLTLVDHPSVVPPLAALIRSGRTDEVTDQALVALRAIAHPSALEVLVELTQHRRPRARRLAYQALAAIEDRRVPELVEAGLRDSDRNVRAIAARELGEIGARRSVDTLFVAFERGLVEAAGPIGKLGDRQSIERFTEHLGQVPLSVMLAGYHAYLRRDDIPDPVKIQIVERLREVSGPMVRQFLQRYLDTFPSSGRASRSPVRNEVIETLRIIPGSANAARGRVVPAGSAEAREARESQGGEQ